MTSPASYVLLPGSERVALPHAKAVGPVGPDERLEVTLRLRGQSPLADRLPHQQRHLTREEFAAVHGADRDDLARVAAFAHSHGLTVVQIDAPRRSVVLSATAAAFQTALGVELSQYEHPGGAYRGRVGGVHLPAELLGIVQGVFGLDDRPQCKPHFQRQKAQSQGTVPIFVSAKMGLSPFAETTTFTPTQLAALYDFPTGADGSGQCIGIIELGGGYRTGDLQTYFAYLGLPPPTVKAILVDHAHNHPTTADGADGEVMLDIEVAAAVAPKARIAVYFAPNTDRGFLDAITTAIHDRVNRPSVISISWGSAEAGWTAQALQQFNEAFQAAAAMGISICCAAGDNGSGDGVGDGLAHVDFPASSPYALACGGTRLVAAAGKVQNETVWNDGPDCATGGGVSEVFPLPAWQQAAGVPPSVNSGRRVGRGVPDVAGNADPDTGYQVRVDGQDMSIGGTSAVAPLWAGLIALLNQQLGRTVGDLHPRLYAKLSAGGALRDITAGNNGAYTARAGWDPCTGWGVPNGGKLLEMLRG